MRLEKASYKAIKYACMNFHYAKSVPVNVFGYSVFNEKNEWCGCIVYGSGAVSNIGKPFGLNQGQVYELVRVALNGKQELTSKALSISLRLFKTDVPLCRLIVSYADSNQGHYGIIYQATNWIFINESIDSFINVNGKLIHRRSCSSLYGTNSVEKLKEKGLNVYLEKQKPKYKYVYCLDNKIKKQIKLLSKEYPKAQEA